MNPAAQPWPDTTALNSSWAQALGTLAPLGNELRKALPQRWVRFYYLPQGKRIAATAAQRAEIAERFEAVIRAVGVHDEGQLVVTTCGWGSPAPAARPARLSALLPASHWRNVADAHPDDPPTSVYATAVAADSPALTELLLDWVATDRTAEVIVAPADFRWLVHPYDGGFDVIAGSRAERDHLASSFPDWLSERDDGL